MDSTELRETARRNNKPTSGIGGGLIRLPDSILPGFPDRIPSTGKHLDLSCQVAGPHLLSGAAPNAQL